MANVITPTEYSFICPCGDPTANAGLKFYDSASGATQIVSLDSKMLKSLNRVIDAFLAAIEEDARHLSSFDSDSNAVSFDSDSKASLAALAEVQASAKIDVVTVPVDAPAEAVADPAPVRPRK
jgi:hypothetical protein